MKRWSGEKRIDGARTFYRRLRSSKILMLASNPLMESWHVYFWPKFAIVETLTAQFNSQTHGLANNHNWPADRHWRWSEMGVLISVLNKLIRWYHEHVALYPPSAFDTMRRGPDIPQSHGTTSSNPLMVNALLLLKGTVWTHPIIIDPVLYLGMFSSHHELVETLWDRSSSSCGARCYPSMVTSSE